MILLDADKVCLKVRTAELITSGSVQAYTVKFKFSSDWDGLIKTAVFRTAATSVSMMLDETNECTIPWEVLATPSEIWNRAKMRLEVGVYGTKDEVVVLPTTWATLGTIQEGAEPGENAREPTPSVYQQLIDQLDDGRKAAQTAAAQAKADADRAAEIAVEMDKLATQVGLDAATASQAKADALTAQGKAETAEAAAETARQAAQTAAAQAKADADRAAEIAVEMDKLATQVGLDAATASQAKADALTAQGKAETAEAAAETARQAAEDAATQAGTNSAAAEQAATRAEYAANDAAAALAELLALYREMQNYVADAIHNIQTEGDTQVQRVADEGAAQVAAAEEAAAQSKADAEASKKARQGAEDAQAGAEAARDSIVTDQEKLAQAVSQSQGSAAAAGTSAAAAQTALQGMTYITFATDANGHILIRNGDLLGTTAFSLIAAGAATKAGHLEVDY